MEFNNEPEAAITLRPRGNTGKTVRGQQLRKRLARLDYALCKKRQIKGKKISVLFFSDSVCFWFYRVSRSCEKYFYLQFFVYIENN